MHDLCEITSSSASHPVRLAEGRLREIVAACAPTVVIADEVFRQDLEGGEFPVILVTAVEESKELGRTTAIVEALRRTGLTRDGMIVAVGGGIVQDLSCFVASVYMRGVRWTYVPTTLLGMVDSCIGGKSSINVGDFKNLVGTFYPPTAVVIPPAVLATLPTEHVAAGRAEAAKICFAHGADTFDRYLALDRGGMPADPGALIALSLRSKKWFIETDEFDRGERLLLNFGHSFGHALESCSAYAVPHGVGVGVGCLAAIAMSQELHPALVDDARIERLSAQLLEILAPLKDLPVALADVSRADFFRYFDSDKKHSPTHYRPVLIDPAARLYRASLPRSESVEPIWRAFDMARRTIAAALRPSVQPVARTSASA